MKVEFVSVDEREKHYSLRTSDGHVYFGRDYLDSCFLKRSGNRFDLYLDLSKANAKIEKRSFRNKF
jgi:hypothetical protein